MGPDQILAKEQAIVDGQTLDLLCDLGSEMDFLIFIRVAEVFYDPSQHVIAMDHVHAWIMRL